MRTAQEVFTGSVSYIRNTMDKRAIRPYPPAAPEYNGSTSMYGTPDLEGDGSGLDGLGYNVEWRRKRYNTTNEVDELLQDNSVDASTEYRVRVFVDPGGANTEVFTGSWAIGAGPVLVTRLEIVNEAAAGTDINTVIETRHDIGTETNLEALNDLEHTTTPTSALSSQFYLGGKLRASTASNSYTALATGTYAVNIGSTFNSQIQYRLNGGTWTNLAGYTPGASTSGTIPGVTTSDTIELQHLTNPASPPLTFVELQNPSATAVAYGVMSN
jgi:hypothetical protein